jgi:hypothetical protein
MVSVGCVWIYVIWIGLLEASQLWLALVVLGGAVLVAAASLAAIFVWMLRWARQ